MDNFWEKAKSDSNTEPMTEEQTKLFATVMMAELNGTDVKDWNDMEESERPFIMSVIKKLIDVFKLPINFTTGGVLALEILTRGRVGYAIAALIDCLGKYEGKTVNVEMMSELYPWGFYKEEVAEDYIDNYLKPRKVKWAEIY